MKKYTEEEALGAIKWIIENSGKPVTEARELISTIFNQNRVLFNPYLRHKVEQASCLKNYEQMMEKIGYKRDQIKVKIEGGRIKVEDGLLVLAKKLTRKKISQIDIYGNKDILKTHLNNIEKCVLKMKKPLELKKTCDKAKLTYALKNIQDKKL